MAVPVKKRTQKLMIFLLGIFLLAGCGFIDDLLADTNASDAPTDVTSIETLEDTDNFRPGALEHILEGELNRSGKAVGFHYNQLPSKKGEIIEGTETTPNEQGVYEAEVSVDGVTKESNRGRSTFFPDDWDTQDVVDAINEVYENRTFISGNTYEGLTEEGVLIRMYIDDQERIISAFPVY